jgi:hypothetical protein
MMESLTNLMYVGDSIDISIQYILIWIKQFDIKQLN